MKKPTPKQTPLERFFKTHRSSCSVHVYSGDRHCSCGRDEAWQEVLRIQAALSALINGSKDVLDEMRKLPPKK